MFLSALFSKKKKSLKGKYEEHLNTLRMEAINYQNFQVDNSRNHKGEIWIEFDNKEISSYRLEFDFLRNISESSYTLKKYGNSQINIAYNKHLFNEKTMFEKKCILAIWEREKKNIKKEIQTKSLQEESNYKEKIAKLFHLKALDKDIRKAFDTSNKLIQIYYEIRLLQKEIVRLKN